MRSTGLFSILVTIIFLPASRLEAIWAPVPLEILIDEADVVVQGKVVAIEKADLEINGRAHDLAVVEVDAALKNILGMMKLMQVRIAQPAAGGLGVSTDIRFREGQDGIWILNKAPDRDIYHVNHPFQFQATQEKDRLAKLVAEREKVVGGKPVVGLEARAEVIETHTVDGQIASFYEVRFSLKNTTGKPITICDYVGHKPLAVQWTDPKGAARESGHYDYLATVRLAGMTKSSFVTIPPNGIRYLGPRGKYSGIHFATIERSGTNHVEPGEHTVTVAYKNEVEGRGLVAEPAWTGEVEANAVKFSVK